MPATNGRADVVGAPIELGDFFPERRQVVLNGQKYLAWVATNKRYPRSIMARLDKAARVYNRVVSPLLVPREDNEEISQERLDAMDAQPEAWEQYVNECVTLLIPGLLESEIELVGLDVLEKLLRDLGYFRDTGIIVTDTEADPEATPLIGDTAQDDSPTSTPDIQLISS